MPNNTMTKMIITAVRIAPSPTADRLGSSAKINCQTCSRQAMDMVVRPKIASTLAQRTREVEKERLLTCHPEYIGPYVDPLIAPTDSTMRSLPSLIKSSSNGQVLHEPCAIMHASSIGPNENPEVILRRPSV